jgi:hypothetical protein
MDSNMRANLETTVGTGGGSDNKKGEPGFAFSMVVGADGFEPPTYAL